MHQKQEFTLKIFIKNIFISGEITSNLIFISQTQKTIKMTSLLEQSKQITSEEYISLSNPIFKGQTRLDNDNMYWMVFEDNGVLYKIHSTL
jgi:hypothetical protein